MIIKLCPGLQVLLLNCSSDHVVYAIQSTSCDICYIGCTIRKGKTRIADHLAAITKNHSHRSGAAAHFVLQHSGSGNS